MSEQIEIREAKPADFAAYRDIRLQALRLEPSAFAAHFDDSINMSEAEWKSRLDGSRGPVFLACVANKPIGLMGLIPSDMRSRAHRGVLAAVYVAAAWRGKGVADALLMAIENAAKARNITFIDLYVNASNPTAHKFYLRHGYQDIGVIPKSMIINGMTYDEIAMCKELA